MHQWYKAPNTPLFFLVDDHVMGMIKTRLATASDSKSWGCLVNVEQVMAKLTALPVAK